MDETEMRDDWGTLTKVGARCPCAVADVILGKGMRWNESDQKERRARLESAFDKKYHMPLRDLFDPDSGSPLYNQSVEIFKKGRVL